MSRILFVATLLSPAVALAHEGHGAPELHSHFEYALGGVAVMVLMATLVLRRLRR